MVRGRLGNDPEKALFCPELEQVDQRVRGLLHVFQGDPLGLGMEVAAATNPGTYSVLWFSDALIAKITSHLGMNRIPNFEAVPFGTQYFNKIIFSLLNQIKSQANFEKIETQWMHFCHQLFENGTNQKVLIPDTLDQPALKKAYDYILCNADENISLQDIAAICGLLESVKNN